MALTNNQMEMIKYISKNDLSMAKKAALACLVEDNSKKNASEVSYYTRILQSSSLSMVQLRLILLVLLTWKIFLRITRKDTISHQEKANYLSRCLKCIK